MRFILKILVAMLTFALVSPVLAAALPCSGSVVIGEGENKVVTSVPNRSVGETCFNDQIIDTTEEGANYGNHGEFIAHVTQLIAAWTARKFLSPREASELRSAAIHSAVERTMKVRIIAFNDFHGNLQSPGTFGVQADGPGGAIVNQPAGGVDSMAGYVSAQKVGHPNSVVVSAGDLIGASPLISAFFHDEGSIETMNQLGLEFNAVGNHKFNEGKEELLRMQNGGV